MHNRYITPHFLPLDNQSRTYDHFPRFYIQLFKYLLDIVPNIALQHTRSGKINTGTKGKITALYGHALSDINARPRVLISVNRTEEKMQVF
ncbi:hypothetical protein ACWKW6_23380 [Dyadobacter jiangsuensis]